MDDFRFCSNCGKKVYGTSNFCPKCGHKLKKAIEPPAGLTEDKKTSEQVPRQEIDKIIYKNNIYKEEKIYTNPHFLLKKAYIAAAVVFLVAILTATGIYGYKHWLPKLTQKAPSDTTIKKDAAINTPITESSKLKNVNIKINQVDNQSFPLVKLYASITDENNEFIENVLSDYFTIREKNQSSNDYVTQKIQSVTPLNVGSQLNICMVMDTSGSMSEDSKLQNAITAAENFINIVNSTDQLAILEFNDFVRTKCSFTNDKNALISSVKQLYPSGQTALFDAIYTAIAQTSQKDGPKCVVVFSDGLNNKGTKTKQDVIDLAKKTGIPVYTISIGDSIQSDFSGIDAQTGVNYLNTPGTKELESIYKNIFRDQQHQYVITYTSSNPIQDNSWRNIELSLSNNNQYAGTTTKVFTTQIVKPNLITVDAAKVNEIFRQNGISGNYSLVIKDLSSGAVSSIGAYNQRMPASALINVAVTLAVADMIKDGRLSLDTKIPFIYSVPGRGKFTANSNGELHSVDELLQVMMNYSDNNCTNTFLSYIGINQINNIIHEYGFTQTEIQLPLNTKDGSKENWSTCEEISKMLELLYSDSLPIGSEYMNANFRIQDSARNSGVLKYLPSNINIINHNGVRDNLYNEIAFIGAGTGGRKYILTIMSCNSPQAKLAEAAARSSEYIFNEMTK